LSRLKNYGVAFSIQFIDTGHSYIWLFRIPVLYIGRHFQFITEQCSSFLSHLMHHHFSCMVFVHCYSELVTTLGQKECHSYIDCYKQCYIDIMSSGCAPRRVLLFIADKLCLVGCVKTSAQLWSVT
jgi:hypothetical protein